MGHVRMGEEDSGNVPPLKRHRGIQEVQDDTHAYGCVTPVDVRRRTSAEIAE